MSAIYLHECAVHADDIDGQGHANNIAYFKWLQAAAIAHSRVQGWSSAEYKSRGWAWVVRSHFIEYRRPAFAEDPLIVKTWVADMKKFSSLRKYEVLQGSTGQLIARAETNWAFVSIETGRLVPVPPEVCSAFEIITNPKAANS